MSWANVGDALRRARALRQQTQADFAAEIGLSTRLLGQLEAGRDGHRYDAGTIHRVELALGWAAGSVERVVAGGRPVVEADPLFARVRDAWPHLTVESRRLLATLAGEARRQP